MTSRTVLAVLSLLAAAPAAHSPAGQAPRPASPWHELAVPHGVRALAEAAGLPPETDRWSVVGDVYRRLHAVGGELGLGAESRRSLAAHVGPVQAPGAAAPADGAPPRVEGGPGGETIPLPLAPELWLDAVFGGRVAPGSLLAAIVTDRQAVGLYHALSSLDDETLTAVGDHATVARVVRDARADTLAMVASRFRVRGGRVAVPGGEVAEAAWEALVGVPPSRPNTYLVALLDRGHLACLHSTLASLDPPHQAFAFGGRAAPSADRLQALARAVARQGAWWLAERGPLSRPPADALALLSSVEVSPDGVPDPPGDAAFWASVFGEGSPSGNGPGLDAVWLLEKVSAAPPGLGRARLETLALAQRVFRQAEASQGEALRRVLAAHPRFPALLLVLERAGVRDPLVFAAAVERAEQIEASGRRERLDDARAQFQGALALVDRARWTGILPPARAEALVRSLAAVPHEGSYAVGLAAWLDRELLPTLSEATGSAPGDPAEDVVVRALAGVRPGGTPPTVTWEGLAYRVDVPAALESRIRRARRRDGAPRLDEALALAREAASRRVFRGADEALARALLALAYAPHLGADPPGRISSVHAFEPEPWGLPREVRDPGGQWRPRGSLLGLDLGLARHVLRRSRYDPPGAPPRLPWAQRQALAEAAALANPFALDEASRDAVAGALARGRVAARAAAASPAEVEGIAERLGLEEPRRRALREALASDPPALVTALTLHELLTLGRGGERAPLDAWGPTQVRDGGGLGPRLREVRPWEELAGRAAEGQLAARAPDLALRVAEGLHDLGLPAALAPFVLELAAHDLTDEVHPACLEDGLAVARHARGLGREQLEDYVSALVGEGPLRAEVDR